MHPFSTPWKHQKTLRFSNVFRGYRKGALETNELKDLNALKDYYAIFLWTNQKSLWIWKRKCWISFLQIPVDTGRKLNVHKMFNLRPVSTGIVQPRESFLLENANHFV